MGRLMTEEKSEEKVHIYLDFADRKNLPTQPGSKIQLKGLDTNQPVVVLEGGLTFCGKYKDTLGSQIFLEESVSGERSADSELKGTFPEIIGITDKAIVFMEENKNAAMGAPQLQPAGAKPMASLPAVKKDVA